MRVWTLQPRKVVEQFESLVPMLSIPEFSELDSGDHDPTFRPTYDWLVAEMRKRVPIPHPGHYEPQYPWWCWVHPDYKTKSGAPDMRHYRRSEESALIELEIDVSQLLCSDYELWHCILNRGAITVHEDEQIGVIESWPRVFEVDPLSGYSTLVGDKGWIQGVGPTSIQACFWVLDPLQVKSIKWHKGKTK